MILLADLELQALVCSGRPAADGTHTYARFADRVPSPRRLDHDEALAELALRYFTGHGPATERDLAYWATLPLGDVRAGLAQVSDRLESFEHDGRTFWHAPADRPGARGARPVTCCRSWTRRTAATRSRAGCSTAPASCRGLESGGRHGARRRAARRGDEAHRRSPTGSCSSCVLPPVAADDVRRWRPPPAGTASSSAAPRCSRCAEPRPRPGDRSTRHDTIPWSSDPDERERLSEEPGCPRSTPISSGAIKPSGSRSVTKPMIGTHRTAQRQLGRRGARDPRRRRRRRRGRSDGLRRTIRGRPACTSGSPRCSTTTTSPCSRSCRARPPTPSGSPRCARRGGRCCATRPPTSSSTRAERRRCSPAR